MNINYHYSTVFSSIVRNEIADAMKNGMPIKKITAELGDIYVECLWAAITQRQIEESQKCAA